MNYKKMIFAPLSIALVVSLSACSLGGGDEDDSSLESFGVDASKIREDGIAKEAEKNGISNNKASENTDADSDNSASNDNTDNTASNVGNIADEADGGIDALSTTFPAKDFNEISKKYTEEDLYNGAIFIEVQNILGAKVFENNGDIRYDVLKEIEKLDEKTVNDAVVELEKRFPMDRSRTSYAGLTPAEKILFNTYMATFKAEIGILGDVKFKGVDNELATIDSAGDMVLPYGSVLVTYDGGETALYDNYFRMYKDGDEWKLDALDFIGQYYSVPTEEQIKELGLE